MNLPPLGVQLAPESFQAVILRVGLYYREHQTCEEILKIGFLILFIVALFLPRSAFSDSFDLCLRFNEKLNPLAEFES